jgi:hypothetical protein
MRVKSPKMALNASIFVKTPVLYRFLPRISSRLSGTSDGLPEILGRFRELPTDCQKPWEAFGNSRRLNRKKYEYFTEPVRLPVYNPFIT